jgi:hypothetical protein
MVVELTGSRCDAKRLRDILDIILDLYCGQFGHLVVDGLKVLSRFYKTETQLHKDADDKATANQRGKDEKISADDAAPLLRIKYRRSRGVAPCVRYARNPPGIEIGSCYHSDHVWSPMFNASLPRCWVPLKMLYSGHLVNVTMCARKCCGRPKPSTAPLG